jgi:hypothetical protein
MLLGAGCCLALVGAVVRPVEGDPEAAADEQTLRAARLEVDGPSLLDFFRKRTLTPADHERLAGLVRQLGDRSYKVREKAVTELSTTGRAAVPFLEPAVKDSDPEVVRRAERCLRRIRRGDDDFLAVAAARLLARRKPAGTAEVLLAYAPFADSEDVTPEVRAALAAVAWPGDQPAAVLVKGLADAHPLKRALAAEALIRAAPAGRRAAYHKLLKDPDPAVRLRVALAFLDARDREAVPVLIALVAQLPRGQDWQSEEPLFFLAGQDPPRGVQAEGATPARRSAAWAEWWRQHRDRIDLAKVDIGTRQLGYTLVVLNSSPTSGDQVMELDRAGAVRWRIPHLASPRDARVLPGHRVLIAEESGNRVTERNFEGRVLWQKAVASPICCQRLPNGNTFIGTRTELLIVDRAGKEVSRHTHTKNGQNYASALRFPNGQYGVIMSDYITFFRLDATGKELGRFKLDFFSTVANLEALPNDRLLVPEYKNNRVVEYDLDGKVLWQLPIQQPTSVVRLPNGNLLVSSWTRQWLGEIDHKGKVVREQQLDGRPCRVRRR